MNANEPKPVARRKMRKGTESCTECRRRKIRCTFPLGNSAICSPCSSRGSRCVDQRAEDAATAEQERTTLRDRVSRLEDLLKGVVQGGAGQASNQLLTSQAFVTGNSPNSEDLQSDADYRAPFITALDEAEVSQRVPADSSQMVQQRALEVCKTLRSSLPKFDLMIQQLTKHGSWWSAFCFKTRDSSRIPTQALTDFAKQAYVSDSPAELALLVTAYARSTPGQYHLYTLVDSLIIADSAYVASIEGLECLILLAKAYTDVGQPRRAWLTYRRGVAIAQLMGLYRKSSSLHREKLWWSVYHGDRFVSLLLGFPYGVNDAHYGPIMSLSEDHPGFLLQHFTLECARMAAKVIDRNLMPNKPSFAGTVELDEQLEVMGMSMGQGWWEVPSNTPSFEELDSVRDRLLQQLYFFHIRLYLHLPFLVSTSAPSLHNYSKVACLESSRQMLRRFLFLQSEERRECLFECKTVEFMGFMAAVVLLIGLTTSNQESGPPTPGEDLTMIKSAERVLAAESARGNKVSTQCHDALVQLSNPQVSDASYANAGKVRNKILIPYFGIVIRSDNPAPGPQHSLSHEQNGSKAQILAMDSAPSGSIAKIDGENMAAMQNFGDGGLLTGYPDLDGVQLELDYFGSIREEDLSAWLNTSMIDIDEDWNMFLDQNGQQS
ncbi:hypothetical protein B0J14DRAFT_467830 [Halenospora varia]|nr:hypothetical protein B0J14DRAFT_467830 [Halenospora varia]